MESTAYKCERETMKPPKSVALSKAYCPCALKILEELRKQIWQNEQTEAWDSVYYQVRELTFNNLACFDGSSAAVTIYRSVRKMR